ncbi:MAG: translational GTPase TypA [Gemmatimonadota bacterium]|nr:MAG: translational GTPase TypA [Gemmatimonadota bacterium]
MRESLEHIRNIAIIAHVDHGKTTLVDQMFRQAGIFRENQEVAERVMDSDPLERERGITILSKNTAVSWNDVKINIVDTPGHADFGGEVERILRMVDGVLLLVDAAEGPMPQTRFVTRKALSLGLLPVVVINKVDRQDARPLEVHDAVLDLFIELEASNSQLDAPFLYASARDGWASSSDKDRGGDLIPLFRTIIDYVPAPRCDPKGPFQMLVSTIDYSSYLGRIAIGRIERGKVSVGQAVRLLAAGEPGSAGEGEPGRVLKVYTFAGLKRLEVETASAGDIVALAGLEGVEIGMTVTDTDVRERLAGISVEEPTISVDFMVSDSPFAGESGQFVTSRQVCERLYRELHRNVAMRVQETDRPEVLTVSGRGELHLAILMETMRREGYEFQVSRPRVIMRRGPNGERLEPYEELVIDVPDGMTGVVMKKLGPRRAELLELSNPGQGRARMHFKIPARGLFGYRSEFLTDTRGEGVMHHRFLDYGPWAGSLSGRARGVLVADREGTAAPFALFNLQERGILFIGPRERAYEGMIVGEHSRPGDLDVNVSKEKKLTNIRAASADDNVLLEPPRRISLEFALEYIEDDELIEITPDAIRLRKRVRNANERKKAARRNSA